jgi:hypothetical protein
LAVLLRTGNDSNTSGDTFGSELQRGVPPARTEFDYNPPSDDENAELYAAIDELDRTLVLVDAGREARRVAIHMMMEFFERRQSTKPTRSISTALEGDTAKEPETFHYDDEPFDFFEFKRTGINVPRQKRPAHRPRNPRVEDRKVQVVEAYQRLRTNPDLKVVEIRQLLCTRFCITDSYVRQILRTARKVGLL